MADSLFKTRRGGVSPCRCLQSCRNSKVISVDASTPKMMHFFHNSAKPAFLTRKVLIRTSHGSLWLRPETGNCAVKVRFLRPRR